MIQDYVNTQKTSIRVPVAGWGALNGVPASLQFPENGYVTVDMPNLRAKGVAALLY